jgi:hypothetical protein
MNPNIIPLNSLKLIGIVGRAGAGKDTIADYLAEQFKNVYAEPFAGPLKAACAEAFGIDVEEFTDPDFKNEVSEYWGVTPRQIAQFVGTELFRDNVGRLLQQYSWISSPGSFWVTRLAGRLTGALNEYKNHPYTPGDVVIIPDTRFQNEYDWILRNGGTIIHVTRKGADGNVGIPNHASEAGISFIHTPEANFYVTNDGTFEDLYQQVEAIFATRLERKDDNFPL